jgi:hypothetical protein
VFSVEVMVMSCGHKVLSIPCMKTFPLGASKTKSA